MAEPRTRASVQSDRSKRPSEEQEARPETARDVLGLRAGHRTGRTTAGARGWTGGTDGDTRMNAAKAAAGEEISPTDEAKGTAGKKTGRTRGTDGAQPMRAGLEPGTETGAELPTQPLGGSSQEMKLEPGPESPDPVKKRAEDVGTSALEALQAV